MENILQTIDNNYQKTLDECYEAYNNKEMGVVRESMGKLVENFVDDVCDMLNQKFDVDIECKFGESDRIPITNQSGRVLGFQVDKHIYINSELKAIVECKSYLDRSMLIRASDDIGRIKKGINHKIKGFVLSLENAVAKQAEDYLLDEGNVDKIFYLTEGKRNSYRQIWRPEFNKELDKNVMKEFIENLIKLF
tara:strand:- start:163 stop:741 length:579 start_codon:yes stop_codon:yes gene_type:complete